ncbi:MAG: cytochrome P450 [Alphaproteobacteria bacterium]|nr:MAG: cytochrome P450 [Alphaproteobacteria bacterium]
MSEKPKKDGLWKRVSRVFKEKKETAHHKFSRIGKLRVHEFTDPVAAREILRQDANFGTPRFVKKGIGRFIGNALILDEGESWQNMHNLMTDIFSPKGVNNTIAPIITDETDKMIDRWLKDAKPLDLEHEMRGLTAKVVMRVVFSDSISEKQAHDIIEASTVTIESFRKPHKLTVAMRMLGIHKEYIPRMKKTYKQSAEIIDHILEDIIAERRKLKTQPDDILGRLLDATDVATGKPLTQKQIKDQLVMFIVAGHETTAVGLTFSLHELLQGKNKAEYDKVRTEVDNFTHGAHLPPGDYNRLPNVRDAFKEAMRLHPSAYEIARECEKDTVVGGVEIKKFDLVRISVIDMHRAPDLWKDAADYKPERFRKEPFPKAYLPFGTGPRVCLGMTMALTEGTLALAEIFNRVDFNVTERPTGEQLVFTMRPQGKLEATVTERKTKPATP